VARKRTLSAKSLSAKHWPKFAALSPVMVTAPDKQSNKPPKMYWQRHTTVLWSSAHL
jgi:hypothetical protein